MARRIAIIQGHPNPEGNRFGHALSKSYIEGARAGGHEIRIIDIAHLDFPILRSQDEYNSGPLPASLTEAQQAIGWADHVVVVFPLWLGTMPALLKAFLEQIFRPGFAAVARADGRGFTGLLTGKSARIVVTMGMPAFIYRWYFLAHGVRGMKRGILGFCGIRPIRETFIGSVETCTPARRSQWLTRLHDLGRAGR